MVCRIHVSRIHRRSAFTLLELIIVLAVLAALAALVIPVLGWVREQSKYATAAAGAAEALNNLEIYKGATGKYPDRLDSLINTSGALYSKVYEGSGGTFVYGSLVASGPTYQMYNGAGIKAVMQHLESATDPNASTEGVAATATYIPGATTQPTVPLLAIDPAAAVAPYNSKANRIVRAAFPNQTSTTTTTVPAGHQLIVMGIGSRSATSGSTMTAAPVHSGAEPNTYGRFLAVFDVSAGATGRGKVQLKLVLDSEFEVMAKNAALYSSSGPTDDVAP